MYVGGFDPQAYSPLDEWNSLETDRVTLLWNKEKSFVGRNNERLREFDKVV